MAETAATEVASTNGTTGATEHSPKHSAVAPEPVDAYDDDAEEEDDEYDVEEKQQAGEGDDDEYALQGQGNDEDDEDDDYEDEDSGEVGDLDVDAEPQELGVAAPAANGKPSLTALLLADPNAAEEDEGDYDEEEDYDDEEGDGEDYIEESTPITPTSKKRPIEETLDEGEDDEEGISKKVKS